MEYWQRIKEIKRKKERKKEEEIKNKEEVKEETINKKGREEEIKNKKELVQTYFIIVTLLFALVDNIPYTWILFFIISILGYNARLMYSKNDQDKIDEIGAVLVGICFSAIIYYSILIDLVSCQKMYFPLMTALFDTTNNSSVFNTPVNISDFHLTVTKTAAMFFLGLISLFVSTSLSIDERGNRFSSLRYIKEMFEHQKLPLVILISIFIIIIYHYRSFGILAYLIGFSYYDIGEIFERRKL